MSEIKIGELLTGAGFLSRDDLNDALEIAQSTRQKIGEVLIRSAFITQPQLDRALVLQEQIRGDRITVAEAVESLKRLHS